MKSSRLIYTLLVVQTGLIGYLVLSSADSRAIAQVPDSGAQLNQVIEQSKATNAKLDQLVEQSKATNTKLARIIGLLEGGKVHVVAEKPGDAGK